MHAPLPSCLNNGTVQAKQSSMTLANAAIVIPRLIHQTFPSRQLPVRLQQHVAALQARNPGWTHTLYDNEDAERFVATNYNSKILKAYRRIDPAYGAARADLLRHLIIYKLGGVYLDIKSDAREPLDEVLNAEDQYILTQWQNGPGEVHQGFGLHPELAHIPGGEYQNYHLIAVPGHPFTKAAIDKIVSNILHYRPWSGVGKMGVIRTTGPSAYTLAIHPILSTAPHRQVTQEEIGLDISIRNYNHAETFRQHYSTLTIPVARLTAVERIVQRAIERVRQMKSRKR